MIWKSQFLLETFLQLYITIAQQIQMQFRVRQVRMSG